MDKLPDMQKSKDGFYKVGIQKVGVRNIKVPFNVLQKNGEVFSSIANISSYCDLVPNLKGINMSRISRTINNVLKSESVNGFNNLENFVYQLKQSHQTDNIWIKAVIQYFLKDNSPVDQLISYEPIDVTFESRLTNNTCRNFLRVKVNQMSCCPCSKEMSLLFNNLSKNQLDELNNADLSTELYEKLKQAGFGAHNQRSEIDILVELNDIDNKLWIEDIVEISKKAASCPTFSTLKRPDEKYVTEASYMGMYIDDEYHFQSTENTDGPKFVEDITRECALYLDQQLDDTIIDYVVVVNNQESIHSNDIMATAVKTAGRDLK